MRYIFSLIALSVIGLSILTGCSNNAATPIKIESANNNTSAAKPAAPQDEHVDDNAARINLADAKKDFDAGNIVFVDTRAEAQFKQEHIKGAINIPAETAATRYKEIPTGKKIIAYCS